MKTSLELQLIDCNCNDCVFMQRDLDKYRKWESWHRDLALKEFERLKEKAIKEAENVIKTATTESQIKTGEGMLRVAMKMKFQFDKKWLLNYGRCTKLDKDVSFLPMVCQPHTQQCFKHRKCG